jgi:hypothetical protein
LQATRSEPAGNVAAVDVAAIAAGEVTRL